MHSDGLPNPPPSINYCTRKSLTPCLKRAGFSHCVIYKILIIKEKIIFNFIKMLTYESPETRFPGINQRLFTVRQRTGEQGILAPVFQAELSP